MDFEQQLAAFRATVGKAATNAFSPFDSQPMQNIDNHEIETEFDYNWQVQELTPEGKVVPADQGRDYTALKSSTYAAVVGLLLSACVAAYVYLSSIIS